MQTKFSRFAQLLALCVTLALLVLLLAFHLKHKAFEEAEASTKSGRVVWVDIADGKIYGKLAQSHAGEADLPNELQVPAPSGAPTQNASPESDSVRLNPAPNEALLKEVEAGFIPTIGADGTKPWVYYRRPSPQGAKSGSISLIITGLGLKKEFSEAAVKLNNNINLAFSVYTPDLNAWMKSMRAQGHEFLLELPLEPTHFPAVDAGPLALMNTITPEENLAILDKVLSKTSGYVGLLAPRDEAYFAGQKDYIKPVLDKLASLGVLMIFAHNEQRSTLDALLQETTLPYLQADVKIEYAASKERLQSGLDSLASIARDRGHAIGVIEFSPNTPRDLEPWIAGLSGQGLQLVPLSAIALNVYN